MIKIGMVRKVSCPGADTEAVLFSVVVIVDDVESEALTPIVVRDILRLDAIVGVESVSKDVRASGVRLDLLVKGASGVGEVAQNVAVAIAMAHTP